LLDVSHFMQACMFVGNLQAYCLVSALWIDRLSGWAVLGLANTVRRLLCSNTPLLLVRPGSVGFTPSTKTAMLQDFATVV